MLVVLNVGYRLVQIAVRRDAARSEAVLNFAQEFLDDWDSVFTDNNTFELWSFDLVEPLMVSNIGHRESFVWIRIQNFPNEIFRSF